ncbi:MAG: aminopeptidase [Alphaproteobacteria bacterium]|nr:aminopeptidase [Alphaproteobacteria bacterium]
MLTKVEIEKYADVMIWALEKAGEETGKTFKEGDLISLMFERTAFDLAESIYEKCIKRGWNVSLNIAQTPNMKKSFYENANENQLNYLPDWALEKRKNVSGLIALLSNEDLLSLKDADPQKISTFMKSRKPIKDIIKTREQNGDYSWTLCLWPTESMAKQAGLSLDEMFEQVKEVCFLDKENPVEEWNKLIDYNQKVCSWLKDLDIEEFHVKSQNVDLTVGLGEKRQYLSTSGHNIPSFEIFTSPDCKNINGKYYVDRPIFMLGNKIEKVSMEFKDGKCIKMSAEKGEDFLRKQMEIDEGASMIGEFSLTDKRFSKINKFMAEILYDENYGGPHGNCHIAIGSSFANSYTGNQKDIKTDDQKISKGLNVSAIHWDLINAEDKEVTAKLKDGREVLIYKDGQFTLD